MYFKICSHIGKFIVNVSIDIILFIQYTSNSTYSIPGSTLNARAVIKVNKDFCRQIKFSECSQHINSTLQWEGSGQASES